MSNIKKNIVIVGFTEIERNSISIPSLEEPYCYSQKVYYVDSLDKVKYQGYMLIVDNKDNISIRELDKKYRNIFNKFEVVRIYNEKYDSNYQEKWLSVEKIGRELFEYDGYSLGEDWDSYKDRIENNKGSIRFNKDKKEKLDMLYNYIKNYETIKTKDIANALNLSERSIQRYMKDLNTIYHNVGYDYSNDEWYFNNRK